METEEEGLSLLKTEPENPQHEITGLLFMALAALLYGICGVFVRYVTAYRGLALSTIILVRGITQTALTSLIIGLLPQGHGTFRNTQRLWGAIALRGVLGALLVVTLFGSYKLLDFSIASAIFSTSKWHTTKLRHSLLTRPRPCACAYFWQRCPAGAGESTHCTRCAH